MKLKPFELERYFSLYEFNTPYLLSCSDCEPMDMADILENADEECKNMWDNLKLSYTESKGNPILIDEIQKLYTANISHDDILCAIPEEGIYITMRSLIEDGDEVVCTYPAYQSLYEVVEDQGANLNKWEAKYSNGWYFDINELDLMVNENTKMIIINFPHNPTGATISQDEFNKIVEIAKKSDCILFCDEMYRFLEYDPNDRLKSGCEIYDKAIILCGFSKSLAMPGIRLGWIITKNQEIMKKLCVYKDYTSICLSAPSEILGIMALRQKDRIINRNLQIIADNLDSLDMFFNKYINIFSFTKPMAGSIGYVKVDDSILIGELSKELIQEGLMILPSSVYSHSCNAFRLGFGRKDMKECIDVFDRYLSEKKLIN